jgi:hypothetical protein
VGIRSSQPGSDRSFLLRYSTDSKLLAIYGSREVFELLDERVGLPLRQALMEHDILADTLQLFEVIQFI